MAGNTEMFPGLADFKPEASSQIDLPGLADFKPQQAATAQPEPDETSMLEQAISGIGEGALSVLGAPIDFANWSNDLIIKSINKATGSNILTHAERREKYDMPAPLGSSEAMIGAATDLGAITETQPQTRGQRFARRTGQEVGAGVVTAPIAAATAPGRVGVALAQDATADVFSGMAASAAQEYFPDSVFAELVASLAGATAGGKVAQEASNISKRAAYKKAVTKGLRETPDVAQLKNEAKRLYGEAETQGLTATADQVGGFYNDLIAIADNEGLIIGGKLAAGDMSKIKTGYKLAADFADQPLTPKNMMKIRRNFQRIAGSTDPAEARIGVQLLKSYDAFTSPMLPQLAEANRLYAAAMRGNLIEKTIEKARLGAKRSRTLGFDDEVRKRFSKLSMDIVDGKKSVAGLTAQQKQVIDRLAQGGPLENLLTKMGKMAPTGAISAGVTSSPMQTGALMSSVQGSVVPAVVGTGISVGAATTGALSRAGVNALQSRNAKVASAVMRGMSLPSKSLNPVEFNQIFSTWLIQNAGNITSEKTEQ